MRTVLDALRRNPANRPARSHRWTFGFAALAAMTAIAFGQLPPQAPQSPMPAPMPPQGAFSVQAVGGEITDDQLKQVLAGKTLYLRAGYLDNNLEFDESGRLVGHSSQGSYTLSQIQINKVKLSKRKLELQGDRYGLHFLGAAPYEDPTAATDAVKITPKKKTVRISIDREQVEKPKKHKDKNNKKNQHKGTIEDKSSSDAAPARQADASIEVSESPAAQSTAIDGHSDKKATTTNSPADASQMLLTALDKVFSPGIDERMIAAMPDFWKLYYQAAQAKVDYKPSDPGVYRQSAVDQKAKLISVLDPSSNEFAQANGVAGMALYHAVIGSDGKAEEIVAARPIGFGLDENAEQTIRKATFQPAMKDGKPVPVAIDLVVSFRIYSKRTSQPGTQETSSKPGEPVLPGPYTVQAASQQSSNSQ